MFPIQRSFTSSARTIKLNSMKAEVTINELRLNNLLKRGEDVVIVSAIFRSHFNCVNQESGIDYGNNHQNNYQPIPLTEEWLLKFGFQDRFLLCDNHKIDYEITERSEIIFWLNENGINLEFVHQLQNLYFALTGEELKIN